MFSVQAIHITIQNFDDCCYLLQVSEVYAEVFKVISQPPVKDYVPFSWASLVHVKKEHYRALAHYYVAVGILDHKGEFGNKTLETLQFLHEEDEDKVANLIEIRVPQNQNERRYLGTYFWPLARPRGLLDLFLSFYSSAIQFS